MDWNRVGVLLHIASFLPGHPQLTNIRAAALKELQDIDTNMALPPAKTPEADLKAAQAVAPGPGFDPETDDPRKSGMQPSTQPLDVPKEKTP